MFKINHNVCTDCIPRSVALADPCGVNKCIVHACRVSSISIFPIFFLFFSLNSFFSYFSYFSALIPIFPIFSDFKVKVKSGYGYVSQLYGRGMASLHLIYHPVEAEYKGQMSLEGSYWGEGGGGFLSAF